MIFYELKKQLDIRFHFLTLFSLGAIAMSRMWLLTDSELQHTKQFP